MKNTWRGFISVVTTAVLLVLSVAASAQSTGGGLEHGFADPPDAAKPRTWWHWTGSNVTLEGITRDLEWM
jgi:hypothetical protein